MRFPPFPVSHPRINEKRDGSRKPKRQGSRSSHLAYLCTQVALLLVLAPSLIVTLELVNHLKPRYHLTSPLYFACYFGTVCVTCLDRLVPISESYYRLSPNTVVVMIDFWPSVFFFVRGNVKQKDTTSSWASETKMNTQATRTYSLCPKLCWRVRLLYWWGGV